MATTATLVPFAAYVWHVRWQVKRVDLDLEGGLVKLGQATVARKVTWRGTHAVWLEDTGIERRVDLKRDIWDTLQEGNSVYVSRSPLSNRILAVSSEKPS